MTTADRLSARTVHTNPEHENPHKDPKRTETSTVRGKPGRQRARRRHARCFPRPAARYQQRTVLKIQGASHTRSHDRVSAKGPPWMEMEREVAFVKRKGSKRAAGPRHGLVDVAGAPLLAVEADLLRRVLLLRTARRSADVGHRLGWRLVRCRRGGRGRGSRRGGSLRIAVGLALARDNLPPAERAARHRVVVVGKGARGEGLSTCTATPAALSLSPAAAPLAAAVSPWAAVSPPFAAPPL